MAPYRVLIVDEWLIARDYQAWLSRAGHAVVGPAATSASALTLLDKETVDMAVLDFQLREETSAAVAERLVSAGIPFIVVTGHSEADLPEQFSSAPLTSKPLDPDDLLDLLDHLAGRIS